jgi:hypothetical protein
MTPHQDNGSFVLSLILIGLDWILDAVRGFPTAQAENQGQQAVSQKDKAAKVRPNL